MEHTVQAARNLLKAVQKAITAQQAQAVQLDAQLDSTVKAEVNTITNVQMVPIAHLEQTPLSTVQEVHLVLATQTTQMSQLVVTPVEEDSTQLLTRLVFVSTAQQAMFAWAALTRPSPLPSPKIKVTFVRLATTAPLVRMKSQPVPLELTTPTKE